MNRLRPGPWMWQVDDDHCDDVKPTDGRYKELCGLRRGHAGQHAGPLSSWPAKEVTDEGLLRSSDRHID